MVGQGAVSRETLAHSPHNIWSKNCIFQKGADKQAIWENAKEFKECQVKGDSYIRV